jgi:hypothetical protein
MAGVTLAGASLIAVTPVAPPPDPHFTSVNVRLTSTGSEAFDAFTNDLNYFDWSSLANPQTLANIATNLFYDIVNIPYNELKAVDFYSKAALGYPGVYGTAGEPDSYNPQDPNPVLTGSAPGLFGSPAEPADAPMYAPIGPDHSYVPVGFGGTGSWWMESTGNTWGWDEGNFGQVLGLANELVPIPQFSTPFADELQAFAMAEIVANPQGCPFECPDILSYPGRWFNVPLNDLLTGVKVGLDFGKYSSDPDSTAVDPTDDPISPMGLPISWAGQTVQFDPFFFVTSFLKSLAMDPSTNTNPIDAYGSLLTDPSQLLGPLQYIGDLFNDFFGLFPGSFVYWGAPAFYTVPALVGGLISEFTGIANPMKAYTMAPGGAFQLGPYVNPDGGPTPIVGGDVPATDGTGDPHLVNPLDLFTGLPAGFANWIGGLLGYLDPYTYVHAVDPDITVNTTADELAAQLADKFNLPAADFSGLATGLYDWHDTLHDLAIGPLADFSNLLTPWYTDLTFGMPDLVTFSF